MNALAVLALASAILAKPVQVTADHLEILGKQSKAIYSGHAKATRDSTTIRCDRLTVFYTPSAQDIARIEAEGGVEVTDGDRWAKGERADFDNATGVGVVTGHPEARQGGNHVAGTKVTFTTGTDVVDVEDARTLFQENPGVLGAKRRVQIDAQRLRIQGRDHQAIWSGKVKALRGNATIASERMIAYYAGEQEVTRLEALGGVEVIEGERWARGDRADFDNVQGVLVVTGNPQARQGRNRMSGTKVKLTLGQQTIEVDKAITEIDTQTPPLLPKGKP